MTLTEKPDLAAVLTHYGVAFHDGRSSQKVLCPVHEETRPSCSVDFDQQLWNCHGCGAAGDAWTLIMEKEGVGYAAACEIAEGFARSSSGGIPAADDTRDDGLLGHTRPRRAGVQRRPFRPRINAAGRP